MKGTEFMENKSLDGENGREDYRGPVITSVEACLVRLPLDRPTAFSRRQVIAREYALVRIRTEDGVEGIGFCYAGNTSGGLVVTAVRRLFAPLLLGEDPLRVVGLWDEMYQEGLLHGRTGSVMRALSGIDIALWDRNARACELPLHRYLGSRVTDRVPAYASGGYYLEGKTLSALGDEMAGYVALGFKAVKMKVGRLTEEKEAERVAAAREAVGDNVLLMLDANNAWRDLPTALRYVKRFEPYDPYWIEEPFAPDDIENHSRLARQTTVQVATGEIESTRWRFKEILDKGAAAILQTDAAVCGGITEFRRIADTASSYGVNLCPHWFHDLHAQLVATIPNGQYVEFFPNELVLNFRRLLNVQLEHKDGQLILPKTPGLGFEFCEDVISKFATEHWS